jgi:hypothetical protein
MSVADRRGRRQEFGESENRGADLGDDASARGRPSSISRSRPRIRLPWP